MPITIFISYRSNDSDKVDTIVANLRSLKNADGTPRYHIWLDKDSIPEGKNWWVSIVNAIIDCKVFVFMISHEAIQSPNCIAELSYAYKINRHILPVVLEGEYAHNPKKGKKDIPFWDELPKELKDDNIQFLFDTGTQAFQKLIQTLDDLLAKPKKDLHRTVERPPDPRHIDDANNNNVSIYKEARDSALRGDFATADTLFLRLFNADDPDFGEEAGAWIETIRVYQRIIQFDDIEHLSAREKWVNYQENFPL
ncbi:MAG: toll/interleukin-1 receptor domain-containing protein, partial [Anaerolineae bacterium]|nr:toll/interleukin-1 receptor domain-containing protein [Anaerolineae bacterium]